MTNAPIPLDKMHALTDERTLLPRSSGTDFKRSRTGTSRTSWISRAP